MLFVAACDVDSDEDATDTETEDTTDIPADDETNGDQDEAVPEDDSTSDESTSDDAAATDSEDEDDTVASASEDENGESDDTNDTNDTNDEMPVDEEAEVVDPEDIDPEDLQPQETPGMFFDLSVEEANEMTAFNVVEPAHIPEGLEFQTIIGMASMEASIGAESGGTNGENGENGEDGAAEDEAVTITFAYQQPPEDETQQPLPVEFMQSTEIDMSDGMGPEADSEEISVGERDVTRVNAAMQTGEEIIAYVWSEGDVHYSLAAMLGGDLTQEDLEEMIASVPAA